jgi:hypothetical protein
MRRAFIIAAILAFIVTILALSAIADKTLADTVRAYDKAAEWEFAGWQDGQRVFFNTNKMEARYVD